MENNHKDEEAVIKILILPSKGKERRLAWKELTRKGDFQANIDHLKNKSGKISVTRDTGSTEITEFVPCTYCLGFFHSRTLYKHSKRFFMKSKTVSNTPVPSGKNFLKVSRVLLDMEVSDTSFREINAVLAKMKRCELHLIIRNDQAFLLYGTIMLQKKKKKDIATSDILCVVWLVCFNSFGKSPGKNLLEATILSVQRIMIWS